MIIKGQVKEVMMRDMGVAGLHKDSEFIVTMEVLGTETELRFPVERETVGNYDLDMIMDLDIDVQRVVRLDGPDRYKVADDTTDRIPFEDIDNGRENDENEESESYDDKEFETYDEETQEQQEASEGSEQACEEQHQEETKQTEQIDNKADFLDKIMNKQSEKTEENKSKNEERTTENSQSTNKQKADSSVDKVVNDSTGEMTDEEIAQKMGRKEKVETEHVETPKVTNPTDNLTESDYLNEGESFSGGMGPSTQEETETGTQNSSENTTNEQNERSSQFQNNENDASESNAGPVNNLNMMGGYAGNEEADDDEGYENEG